MRETAQPQLLLGHRTRKPAAISDERSEKQVPPDPLHRRDDFAYVRPHGSGQSSNPRRPRPLGHADSTR